MFPKLVFCLGKCDICKIPDYMYKKSVIAFEICLQVIESLESGTLKVNKVCYLSHTILYGIYF
jgi:hypothetical protein